MKRTLAAIALLLAAALPQFAAASDDKIVAAAQKAEARLGARVGLAIQDTGSGESWN